MKINGRKIRSKSMKMRKNSRRKLAEMNRRFINNINENRIGKRIGMKFLTNFGDYKLALYRRAAYMSELRFRIIDDAYYKSGKGKIPHMKAMYVDKRDYNKLPNFWSIICEYGDGSISNLEYITLRPIFTRKWTES